MSKRKEPRADEKPRIEVRNPRYAGKTPEEVVRAALLRPATREDGESRKGDRSER